MIDINIIPVLKDNYSYLITDIETGKNAIIDPGDAIPIIEYLQENNIKLDYILNTHHHWDHTDGNKQLKKYTNAKVFAYSKERNPIPGVTDFFNDTFRLGNQVAKIIHTPGHTLGHICIYFSNAKTIFVGDTIFSIGCGGLFEGTAEQLFNSIKKIKSLPNDTKIYCGHEYTLINIKKALRLEPNNEDLLSLLEFAKEMHHKKSSTIPTTIEREKRCNPYFRTNSAEIIKNLNLSQNTPEVEVFRAIRSLR